MFNDAHGNIFFFSYPIKSLIIQRKWNKDPKLLKRERSNDLDLWTMFYFFFTIIHLFSFKFSFQAHGWEYEYERKK